MRKIESLTDKEKRKYKCDWPDCGEEFEQAVATAVGGGNHQSVSDHVICPRCGNGLPT
ncbi:hypothetical protein LCGC14_1047510 [marine sediment metagenome]|uniref:Uncharacterized protein n=1 Tax=marine sediment metagenome TaxID=412755 RepID=A0A0F9Q833_9ZZZZ